MMQDTEELPAGRRVKTALNDPDASNLLQEFAEQKRKERENDPEVKRMKNKYRLKAPKYPSPGNLLHTGRQLPRTPAPGVLPLLPSQRFDPITGEDEESFGFGADNMVPCGRQLPRTPTRANVSREIQVKDDENCKSRKSDGDENGAIICEAAEAEIAGSERNDEKCTDSTVSDAMPEPVTSSSGGDMIAQKEVISEDNEAPGRPAIQNNRRISEMPVQGLHQTRISGVLKKMAGYECRNEDLEFLKQMENQEKAKGLKEVISEDIEAPGRPVIQNNRRISEMPVMGLHQTRISGVLKKMAGYECRNEDLEFLKQMENQEKAKVLKEVISEDNEAPSRPVIQNNRRISEMPVQGLHQTRISGVLKKMAGYECRNEDLEFLKHMENQEKAKGLKKELLCLRKDLAATNREKESVLAKKEKIEDDVEKMKLSLERTVRLGRGLLSRTQDPASHLSPDEVLERLNPMTIQNTHQQARLQLAAAEEELAGRRQEAADRTSLTDDRKRSLTLKVESSEQHIKEAEYRVQQLKEEVITLKTHIKRTEENKLALEAGVQKKRQQISYCVKHVKQNGEMSEEERAKMNRRLQRILHRRDNYLERERILQRLKEELQ